jgi:hypothetical protein
MSLFAVSRRLQSLLGVQQLNFIPFNPPSLGGEDSKTVSLGAECAWGCLMSV